MLSAQVDYSAVTESPGDADEGQSGISVVPRVFANIARAVGIVRKPVAGKASPFIKQLLFTAEGASRGSWVDFNTVLGRHLKGTTIPPDLRFGPVFVRLRNATNPAYWAQVKQLATSGVLDSVWLDLNTVGEPDNDPKNKDKRLPISEALEALSVLAPHVTEARVGGRSLATLRRMPATRCGSLARRHLLSPFPPLSVGA